MENEKNTTLPAVSFDEFKIPTYEEWKEAAIAALKGAPFDKKCIPKLTKVSLCSPSTPWLM